MSALRATRPPTSAPSALSFASAHSTSSGGQPSCTGRRSRGRGRTSCGRPPHRASGSRSRVLLVSTSVRMLPVSGCHGRGTLDRMASHLSDVWFSVTDLEVASRQGVLGHHDRRRRVPRLHRRHRGRVDRALPSEGDGRDRGTGGSLHPRAGELLPPRPARAARRPRSPRSRPRASTRSSSPTPVRRSPKPR